MCLRLGAIAVLLAGLFAGTSSAVDPSGTWRWEHQDLEGTGQIIKDVLKLKFDDGKVSGTYAGPGAELEIENAKLDGDTLHWELNVDAQGQSLNIAWTGKISGDDVNGTVKLGDFGEFPWAARRDAAEAVDPSGTWRWEHQDLEGTGEVIKDVLTLKFDDGKVSGTYVGPDGELEIENAKLDGDTLHWELNVDAQGQSLNIAWTGKISGDNVNGTVKLGDFGEFPWSARRDARASAGNSNKWNLTINMPDGSTQNPVLEIKQDGGNLSATYSVNGQEFPVEDFTPSQDGTFSFTLKMEQAGIVAKFRGQADEETAKGVIEYDANGETGEIDFTAEKAK